MGNGSGLEPEVTSRMADAGRLCYLSDFVLFHFYSFKLRHYRRVKRAELRSAGQPRAAVPTHFDRKFEDFPRIHRTFSLFFRRHIEIHEVALEASRLPRSVGDACDHPDGSRYQRQVRQVYPDEQADGETQYR